MRSSDIAISKIGEWSPSKYAPYSQIKVITCKELSTGKYLKLNLNKKDEKRE